MSENQSIGSPSVGHSGHGVMGRRFRPSDLKGWNFSEFAGEVADPAMAERWIKECNFKFLRAGFEDGMRLQAMTFLLKGHALKWWECLPESQVYPPELGSEEFLGMFRDQFCPDIWREAKAKEFLELVQGERTVMQCYMEFTNLSQWYDEQVNREQKLIRRFKRGLRWEIQVGVTSGDMGSLVTVKGAAMERELLELGKKEDRKRKATAPPSQSVAQSQAVKRPQQSYSGFRSAQSAPMRGTVTCFTCGNPGHKSATCKMRSAGSARSGGASSGLPICGTCGKPHFGTCHLLRTASVTCYTCGQRGHRSNVCPTRSVAPTQSVGSVQGPRAPSGGQGGRGGDNYGRGTTGAGRGTGANAIPVGTGGDQGRLYALTRGAAENANDMVTGSRG
ncbi:hypothetical protein LINPERHAP1_LOCUS27567 [Linum perenne]